MSTDLPGDDIECCSLDAHSCIEADKHKWYMSQTAGYDVGNVALTAWVNDHWPGFLRARWIEHMRGKRRWMELNREEFGLLNREFGDYREILDEIVEMLVSGGENLNILQWSRRTKQPKDQQKVREILHRLRINDHRLQCELAHRLACG